VFRRRIKDIGEGEAWKRRRRNQPNFLRWGVRVVKKEGKKDDLKKKKKSGTAEKTAEKWKLT